MNSSAFTALLFAGLVTGTASWSGEASSDRQNQFILSTIQSRRSEAVEYFVNIPITASTGRENLPWGELQICVKISEGHGHQYISFWDVLTKKGSSWVTAPTALHKRDSGKLDFKSKDNWANEGIGHIEFLEGNHIRFELAAPQQPDKATEQPDLIATNFMPLYGTFTLPKAPCPYSRFFEQLRP